jgi:hypothetical protein
MPAMDNGWMHMGPWTGLEAMRDDVASSDMSLTRTDVSASLTHLATFIFLSTFPLLERTLINHICL